MFSTLLSGLLDLLAPPSCPACALAYQPQAQDNDKDTRRPGFCPACEPLLEAAPAELQPPAPHAAACCYQGPLADAIRRFKYDHQSQLQRELSALLVQSATAYAGLIDAVVPVPLHPKKLRQRGWNPAALLARPVARSLGVGFASGWLTRSRETAAQAGLSRQARAHNVRGAFRAKAVAPARVLLIDDVRTTGATLLEAAGCLAQQGHSVLTLALAWSPHEPDGAQNARPAARARAAASV